MTSEDATLPDATPTDPFAPIAAAIRAGDDWAGVLMTQIAQILPEGGDWCDRVKAQTLAALVLGLRPTVLCEIGVWTGGSLIPMLLALRAVQALDAVRGATTPRRGIAIDAWSPEASCADQGSADRAWWGAQPHGDAKQTFLDRLARHGLTSLCEVVHAPSNEAPVPARIDLLHLDGNHGEQAVRDVERFAPAIDTGGVLVLDDLGWTGGYVSVARTRALDLGFRELYLLGTGIVLQRVV